jgi:hypothetical protein
VIYKPSDEDLEAIKAGLYSGSLLHKKVGAYVLVGEYRQCSALGAHDHWYPETRILFGGRLRYQGEGWASFLHLANNLNTEEEVEAFLKAAQDEENHG